MRFGNLVPSSDAATTNAELLHVVRCAMQIAVLAALSWIGHEVVGLLHLPLPGNLAGMLLTFGALRFGIVRLGQVEIGGALLLRHLPLLFIPLVVAVAGMGTSIASQWAAIGSTLAVSAAVGFAATGHIAQRLLSSRHEGPMPTADTETTVGKSRG